MFNYAITNNIEVSLPDVAEEWYVLQL